MCKKRIIMRERIRVFLKFQTTLDHLKAKQFLPLSCFGGCNKGALPFSILNMKSRSLLELQRRRGLGCPGLEERLQMLPPPGILVHFNLFNEQLWERGNPYNG